MASTAVAALPEPADPGRLMVRSFLHHSLREAPLPPPQPQPPQPPQSVVPLAELIGGHRPYPRRLRQFDSVRGRPVLQVVDDDDAEDNYRGDHAARAWSWTLNANTLSRPLDTLNGLEYATVVAARRRRRRLRWQQQQQQEEEDDDEGEVGLLQLRQFARQFGVGDDWDGEGGGTAAAAVTLRRRPPRPRTALPSTPASRGSSGRRRRPSSTSSRRRWTLTPGQAGEAADCIDDEAQWQQQQELAVLCLLCQVLRTDEPADVQAWLAGATEREKALVADVIRAAMDSWRQQQQLEPLQPQPPPQLPQPPRTPKRVDRLVIEHGPPGAASAASSGGDRCRCASAAAATGGRGGGGGSWPIRLLPPPPPASSWGGDDGAAERLRRRPRLRQQPRPQPPVTAAAVAASANQLGHLCSKLRYTRIDPSLQSDGRTGHTWRLTRGPQELWARLG